MFAHPTCCLKIPPDSLQRVAESAGHRYRTRLEYYGFCCALERITLSALEDKARPTGLPPTPWQHCIIAWLDAWLIIYNPLSMLDTSQYTFTYNISQLTQKESCSLLWQYQQQRSRHRALDATSLHESYHTLPLLLSLSPSIRSEFYLSATRTIPQSHHTLLLSLLAGWAITAAPVI